MTDLKNKKILVTGSTDGLGRLLATELAKLGAEIIVHGREEGKAREVLAELKKVNSKVKHSRIICDFNKPGTVSKAFSKITALDILVNNAGVWEEGDTINISIDRLLELVNVNLTSYLLMTRILLPVLTKAEFAQILNVVSIAGYEVPSESFYTIYSATKFGLQG